MSRVYKFESSITIMSIELSSFTGSGSGGTFSMVAQGSRSHEWHSELVYVPIRQGHVGPHALVRWQSYQWVWKRSQ